MMKKEWSYKTSKEELVNHPMYSNPVIIKRMGTVFVNGYKQSYLFGLIKTTVKTNEETIWDTGYTIFELENKHD